MTTKTDTTPDISQWKQLVCQKAETQETVRRKVLQSVYQALDQLSDVYSWDDAFIFGSVTQPGRFFGASDIDIGIRGLDRFLLYEFIGKISMLLDRDVDVVRLEECRFAEKITSKGIQWTKGMHSSS